jgi:hypothetical protein
MSSLLLAMNYLLISRRNVCSMFARFQQIVFATLIKKKRHFPPLCGDSDRIGGKVKYEEGLPNI